MARRAHHLLIFTLSVTLLAACSRRSEHTPDGGPDSAEQASRREGATPSPETDRPPPGPIAHIGGPELVRQIASSGAKGTIVNAWASWCGPCRREFPMLIALRDNLESQGIDIVFVSVDEPDSEGAALDFATQHGLTEPIWVAQRPLGPFKQALNPKWPGMLPATFLFDGKGKLRYFWGGPVYEQELLPIIEGFVAGKHIDGEARFGLSPGKDSRNR